MATKRRSGLALTVGRPDPPMRGPNQPDTVLMRCAEVFQAAVAAIAAERTRRVYLWRAYTERRPFSTQMLEGLYHVRKISAAEHWATIYHRGYKPRGGNNHA